jgi:hypothetical protein
VLTLPKRFAILVGIKGALSPAAQKPKENKMNAKITEHTSITTDHPASHYGAGVLLVDWVPGVAFGPADIWPDSCPGLREALNAKPNTCGEVIRAAISRDQPAEEEIRAGVAVYPPELDEEQLSLVRRWLSQDPDASR